jgi:hypothetical protein
MRLIKFPITFDKALCLALKGKRLEDRMQIYRWLVRQSLVGKLPHQPTDDEVGNEIALMRQKQFAEKEFSLFASNVRRAAAMFKAQNLKKRGKAGADKQALNKIRKKLVSLLKLRFLNQAF